MEWGGLVITIGALVAAAMAFIWVAIALQRSVTVHKRNNRTAVEATEKTIERIFNDEFREELRNRGRLQFEKIIAENAMFLQQDLRLTASQLNEFMKQEITKSLQEEFTKYEESITDAKQIAIESLEKTREAIEQQRVLLSNQLQEEMAKERERMIERFEKNMADIINHYVLAALGDQIDLDDQLEYILGDLEANKKAIIEDVRSGA